MHIDINGKAYNRTIMVGILLIGTFVNVLNQTILATAFPVLMKALSVDTTTIQWLTTGFLLVNGIMIPISAYLSRRFNTKWLWISAMIIFELGTTMAWLAPSFSILLIGRLIQAVGVGIAMPLLQTIIFSIFSPEQRGSAMGLVGIAVGVGPAVGPTLSGWIIDNYSWRQIFGVMIPIVALIIILSFFYMRPVIKTEKIKLDLISVITSSVGFGSLLYGFATVGSNGWTSIGVLSALIIGLLVTCLFVYRQLTMENPFLDLRVFKFSQFTIATILGAIAMTAMTGAELVLPMYLQIAKGQNAVVSGLTLLPGAILIAILNPITGRIVDKRGGRNLSIGGLLLLTIGTIPFTQLTTNTPLWIIVSLYSIRMIGVAMVLMPITTVGMNALPNNLIVHGTAANNTLRQIFTSIGSAVMMSVLTSTMTSNLPNRALALTNPMSYKHLLIQANLSGYKAAFLVATILGGIGLLLSLFIKNNKKNI